NSYLFIKPPFATIRLLSFPTRRSSDLHHPAADRAHRRHRGQLPPRTSSGRGAAAPRRGLRGGGHGIGGGVRVAAVASACSTARRSEEHTSELQSRFDLVCRLLLDIQIE